MDLRIANTFTDCLGKLTGKVQTATKPSRAGYCLPQALADHSPGTSAVSIDVDPGLDASSHPSRMCRCKLDHGGWRGPRRRGHANG